MEAALRLQPDTFKDQDWIINQTRPVYKVEFELNDTAANAITFKQAFSYSDYIISELMAFGDG